MPVTQYYAGQRITADGLNDLIPPSLQLSRTSAAIASSPTTYTAVSFDTVASQNTASMWSVGQPTRIIAPYPGTFQIHGGITWPATLSTADGRAEVRFNGTGVPAPTSRCGTQRGSTGNMQSTFSGVVVFTAAGQYVEVFANQNSGVSINIAVTFGLTRVSFASS
ncbi:hypothetical protein ACFQ6B_23835 [Streptomyces wedmorensis]|uniref:Uncharacterized protein n=1 Tax=Streptomyces wedmorensis TaxID=43759 RepID=A0ABW6J6K9_STRWE